MDGLWKEFEAQSDDGRIRSFHETLEDAQMIGGLAFEMLGRIHDDAAKNGSHMRFAECVAAFRKSQPDLYDQDAAFYASWCLQDALADGRQEAVAARARDAAALRASNIDTFSRDVEALEYHDQLALLVEIQRTTWPGVKENDDILEIGIGGFAERSCVHEIYALRVQE